MKRITIIASFVLLFMSGCAHIYEQRLSEDTAVSSMGGEDHTEIMEEGEMYAPDQQVSMQGDVTIEVLDVQQAMVDLKDKVIDEDGYVIESSFEQTEKGGGTHGIIVVKVPQSMFYSFLHMIAEQEKVVREATASYDVTEQYVDLQSRLTAKQTVEKRLQTFMEQATSTEDLLKISNELATIQEEIEQLTGKINYLQNKIDYATVTIHLVEQKSEQLTFQDDERLHTWKQAKDLFIKTINIIVKASSTLIIVLIGLTPITIPLIVMIGFIFWMYRKRLQDKKE